MKKLAKNIVLMLTALFLISMATSCKKDEPKPVINFNNPTAQYIESFLGKSVDEFIKACEESGMIKYDERDNSIWFNNQINHLDVGCNFKNNNLTYISYSKNECGLETDKQKFLEFFNYLSGNNYAAFKGWNNDDDKNLCFKDMNEFRNSQSSELFSSTCEMVKTSNGVGLGYYKNEISDQYFIDFASPEDEIYEYMKADAMSSCD